MKPVDECERVVTEHMKGLTQDEQIRFLREVIFLKNTGRRPQRWIEVDNLAKAMGIGSA